MSKASLKKTLAKMDSASLVELICEMYDARPEAKDYLEYWLSPDPDAAFEKAREEVWKKFFFSSGKTRGLPTATELKKIVKYYSLLSFDPERIASLMIYITEVQAVWLSDRTTGFTAGLRSLENNVSQARTYVEQAGLDDHFRLRLEKIDSQVRSLADNPPETRRGRRRRRRW